MRFASVKPVSRPSSIKRFAAQSWRVSKSSKKSAASGRNPARRAASARARPEDAAIRIAASVSGDLTCETESIAKIEADRLGGSGHPLEQSRFRLVFHVANRKRSNPETAASQLDAISVKIEPFDPGRGHRVDIGRDKQGFGACQHRSRENLHARRRAAERNILVRQRRGNFLWGLCLGGMDSEAKSLLDLIGLGLHLIVLAGGERYAGTFQRRDHAASVADRACRAKNHNACLGKRLTLLFQDFFHAGDHRGGGGKGTGGIG